MGRAASPPLPPFPPHGTHTADGVRTVRSLLLACSREGGGARSWSDAGPSVEWGMGANAKTPCVCVVPLLWGVAETRWARSFVVFVCARGHICGRQIQPIAYIHKK